MSEGAPHQSFEPPAEQLEADITQQEEFAIAADGTHLTNEYLLNTWGIDVQEANRAMEYTDTVNGVVYSGTVAQMLTECPLGSMVQLAHTSGGAVGIPYAQLKNMCKEIDPADLPADPKKN